MPYIEVPPHPTWKDFAKALYLVDIYVSLETGKCDENTSNKLRKLAATESIYNDPPSYIRYVMYPRLMREALWLKEKPNVGRGTELEYYGRRGDIDQFFSQMIAMKSKRSVYIDMASIIEDHTITLSLDTIF